MIANLCSLLVLLAQAGATATGSGAAGGHADAGPHGRGQGPHRHTHGRDRFKNPADLAAYIGYQEEPARQAWQKPDEVLKALSIRSGQTVCDIGAGPGYFALRLARLVGQGGRVYAVDVEPRILEVLRDRVAAAGTRQVTPVLALPDDPLIPDGACDLALVVDTYHHFPDGAAYLRRLRRALAPRGRIVNIDFHKRPTPVGPEMEHRISREDFLRDAHSVGLKVVAEPTFLENQYFLVLEPRRSP